MVGGDGGDDDVYLCRPVNIDVDLYYEIHSGSFTT